MNRFFMLILVPLVSLSVGLASDAEKRKESKPNVASVASVLEDVYRVTLDAEDATDPTARQASRLITQIKAALTSLNSLSPTAEALIKESFFSKKMTLVRAGDLRQRLTARRADLANVVEENAKKKVAELIKPGDVVKVVADTPGPADRTPEAQPEAVPQPGAPALSSIEQIAATVKTANGDQVKVTEEARAMIEEVTRLTATKKELEAKVATLDAAGKVKDNQIATLTAKVASYAEYDKKAADALAETQQLAAAIQATRDLLAKTRQDLVANATK